MEHVFRDERIGEYRLVLRRDSRRGNIIEIFSTIPPRLSQVTLDEEEQTVNETDLELPKSLIEWYMAIPEIVIYVTDLGDIRSNLFNRMELCYWDGPVANVSEIRKQLLTRFGHREDDAQERNQPVEIDRGLLHVIEDSVSYLFGTYGKRHCGCSAEVPANGVEEVRRCEACGAIMCRECRAEDSKNCNGCFELLLDSANDIGDMEDLSE